MSKFRNYKICLVFIAAITLQINLLPLSQAATPKIGSKCTNQNEVQLVKNVILMCMPATNGWTWQSMGTTTKTPTKSASLLPLVPRISRTEVTAVNSYIGCLRRNGLTSIKSLSDIWAIDSKDSTAQTALSNCSDIRPPVATKPLPSYIPAQESSTRSDIKIISIGKSTGAVVGNTLKCISAEGNYSVNWGITIKPLFPSFIATTNNSTQSLAYFQSTKIDDYTIRIDSLGDLAKGKYLTCVVTDPAVTSYTGSASLLIPKN